MRDEQKLPKQQFYGQFMTFDDRNQIQTVDRRNFINYILSIPSRASEARNVYEEMIKQLS
jgi:hypothetical protein